jgi:NAD-dependent dihydropyrimidine dehydrogenase PreA subunit
LTYVIAQPCIDVKDKACVEECPVDCIYEGQRSLYIHPDECVDCGACEPVCPVEAIFFEDDVPAAWSPYVEDNERFFTETLPGQDGPLASPGGASKVGALAVDTPLVASFRPADSPVGSHG